MKKALVLASLFLSIAPAPARAERTVREISWPALKAAGGLANGEVVPAAAARRSNRSG